ncbi:MAG: hypothetical protein ABII26_01570 [Pseudomonadota bacterium]
MRKGIYKIIAGALILSLLSFGAVPATGACEGQCGCCNGSGNRVPEYSAVSRMSHSMRGNGDLLKVFFEAHSPYASLQNRYLVDPWCHEETFTASCNMDHSLAHESLQVSTNAPRAERFILNASALVSSEIPLNDHHFFGLSVRHILPVRAAPIPPYLQKLSLRC